MNFHPPQKKKLSNLVGSFLLNRPEAVPQHSSEWHQPSIGTERFHLSKSFLGSKITFRGEKKRFSQILARFKKKNEKYMLLKREHVQKTF